MNSFLWMSDEGAQRRSKSTCRKQISPGVGGVHCVASISCLYSNAKTKQESKWLENTKISLESLSVNVGEVDMAVSEESMRNMYREVTSQALLEVHDYAGCCADYISLHMNGCVYVSVY